MKMKSEISANDWRFDEQAKTISYFSTKSPTIINRELIRILKNLAEEHGGVNARLCLHNNPDETLHDMIILAYQDKSCKKPHKHLDKDETLQIIEGTMEIFLFDDEGKMVERKTLTDEGNFMYRTLRNMHHLYLPKTNYMIYRETKQGPFQRGDNILPKWNHTRVLKKYVDFMSLRCDNESCKTPCSLNKKLRETR